MWLWTNHIWGWLAGRNVVAGLRNFYIEHGLMVATYSTTFRTLPIAIVLSETKGRLCLQIAQKRLISNLLSSLKVKRPICGNSLNCSRHITPAHSILIMATCSCLTNRGLVLLFSPVFLSTRHINAWKQTSNHKLLKHGTANILLLSLLQLHSECAWQHCIPRKW